MGSGGNSAVGDSGGQEHRQHPVKERKPVKKKHL